MHFSTTKLTTDPNTKQTTYIMITDMTTQTASDSTTLLETESTTDMRTEGPTERGTTRPSTTIPIEEGEFVKVFVRALSSWHLGGRLLSHLQEDMISIFGL